MHGGTIREPNFVKCESLKILEFEKRPSYFNNGHAEGNFAVDWPAVKTHLFTIVKYSNVELAGGCTFATSMIHEINSSILTTRGHHLHQLKNGSPSDATCIRSKFGQQVEQFA